MSLKAGYAARAFFYFENQGSSPGW
uniref:Uncharacterized protein n=1 Tax=Arundo donax TaxID=35708 RepID=A0A0A8Y622_ARUDO